MVVTGGGVEVSVAGCGICALSPFCSDMETTTMNTMMSTNKTSIMGVMLISAWNGRPPADEKAIPTYSSQARVSFGIGQLFPWISSQHLQRSVSWLHLRTMTARAAWQHFAFLPGLLTLLAFSQAATAQGNYEI